MTLPFDRLACRGTVRPAHRLIALTAALLLSSTAAGAAPAIRTHGSNPVPVCVSPERLMAFLSDRNPTVDPRYRDIARWYQYYGNAWNVRWDYAFFQMAIETNYLKFRRADGRRGDVHEQQNNFAGIGATGRGVPGDRFPDIKTGVHAQIQHLVAYSGERLADPVAPRTQLKQDDIIDQSRRLRRAVTFGDLARRWAADRAYARSIDFVAEQYRASYCNRPTASDAGPPAPQPARRNPRDAFPQPSGLGGPKMLRLAGPDDLPWATQAAAGAPPASTNAPASGDPARSGTGTGKPDSKPVRKPASKADSPVRTIWSRDGTRSPARQNTPATASERTESAPAPPSAAPSNQAEPEAEIAAPALPTFKIQPTIPQPSRLGGPPLPDDATPVMAPVGIVPARAAPTVRFREIIAEPAPSPSGSTSQAGSCRVLAASYGGKKTLLVRTAMAGETLYTALTVLDGFEKSMFDIYAKANAPGAEIVGEYPSKDEALADARANCPSR